MSISARKKFLLPLNCFLEGDGQSGGQQQQQGGQQQQQGGQQQQQGGQQQQQGGQQKLFTQQELDGIIDKRLGKMKTSNEQLLAKLQALQDTHNLNDAARSELQTQIDTLQESLQTAEQRAAQSIKTAEAKYKREVETLSTDRDTWKSRYTNETIRRAITDAAVMSDAEDPSQLVLMFSNVTRLDEEKDGDGKATGNFIPRMKFQGLDPETKKPVQLDLPVHEAIAHMRENNLHKNLFKHNARPGTGSGASSNKGGTDNSKMPLRENFATDELFSQAYQTWRENHNIDGTPRNVK